MRIGIVTFHRALNYGAVLQSYALYEFLNDMGFEVEIIDYRNVNFEDLYHSLKINLRHLRQFKDQRLKSKICRCVEVIYIHLLEKKFDKLLQDKLSRAVTADEWEEAVKKYDVVVTGSDQVWNKELTNNDMVYYLKGVHERKRVSFAASLGGYDILNDKEALDELNKFAFLSFREKQSKERIQDMIAKKCTVHMDPVFLIKKYRWKKIIRLPETDEKYVLIFSMNRLPKLLEYAVDYAEKNGGMKVYCLSPSLRRARNKNVKQIWFASPEEFLGWFYCAEYIFTDSFHGCAFSVLFEKNFYAEVDKKVGSSNRIIDMLRYFKCEERADANKIGYTASTDITGKIAENLKAAQRYFKEVRNNYESERKGTADHG